VRGIVDTLYARVVALLQEHRPALDALAGALLDRETVDGPEALDILRAHGVPIPEPALS
jgi:ATP-dependent Zn protease